MNVDDTHTIDSFVKAGQRKDPNLHYVAISKTAWGLYTFELVKEFQSSSRYNVLTLATCVGRQPESTTWVLGPMVQVDEDGLLIPPERQQFYW